MSSNTFSQYPKPRQHKQQQQEHQKLINSNNANSGNAPGSFGSNQNNNASFIKNDGNPGAGAFGSNTNNGAGAFGNYSNVPASGGVSNVHNRRVQQQQQQLQLQHGGYSGHGSQYSPFAMKSPTGANSLNSSSFSSNNNNNNTGLQHNNNNNLVLPVRKQKSKEEQDAQAAFVKAKMKLNDIDSLKSSVISNECIKFGAVEILPDDILTNDPIFLKNVLKQCEYYKKKSGKEESIKEEKEKDIDMVNGNELNIHELLLECDIISRELAKEEKELNLLKVNVNDLQSKCISIYQDLVSSSDKPNNGVAAIDSNNKIQTQYYQSLENLNTKSNKIENLRIKLREVLKSIASIKSVEQAQRDYSGNNNGNGNCDGNSDENDDDDNDDHDMLDSTFSNISQTFNNFGTSARDSTEYEKIPSNESNTFVSKNNEELQSSSNLNENEENLGDTNNSNIHSSVGNKMEETFAPIVNNGNTVNNTDKKAD